MRTRATPPPPPIQSKSIPPLLDGRDLLGIAQTGTGKTAAFALPLLHRLAKTAGKPHPRQPLALILAPTRELAGQIGDSLRTYGRHLHLRSDVVFGGVSIGSQIKALARGVHALVATPGRLLDLMNRGNLRLDAVEVFILDEADRMLDMGFIHDVKKITAALPKRRQTLLFSATMPKSVQGLADGLLSDPVRVEAAPSATTVEKVDQRVLFVPKDKKRALISELLNDKDIERALILHPHQARRRPCRPAPTPKRHPIGRHPRQQGPRTPGSGPSTAFVPDKSEPWWRPTSPRAASTSMA